jgi:hypothetical protein
MFDAETAEPPLVVPEYATDCQNVKVARLIPPYVPVDGASGIAAPQICY